jgi:hypothetical protein
MTGEEIGLMFNRVTAIDIERDGDLDLVVPTFMNTAETDDATDVLLINEGGGQFIKDVNGRLPSLPDFQDYTLCVASGDVDGDGSADLFLGEGGVSARLFLNDRTGRFRDATEEAGPQGRRLPADTMRGYGCTMVDTDRDGDLDIVVVNDAMVPNDTMVPVPTANDVLINNGAGYAGQARDRRGLATGDVNQDGWPDIVVSHGTMEVPHNGVAFDILLGQCDGSHALMTGLPTFGPGVFGAAVGDLNGDGTPDVAGASSTPDPQGGFGNILLVSE